MDHENTYRDYWETVEALAQEVADGREAWEVVDGNYYTIYFHSAVACLEHSENEDAHWDVVGSAPEADSCLALVCILAHYAMMADVEDRASRIKPNDDDDDDEEEEEEEE